VANIHPPYVLSEIFCQGLAMSQTEADPITDALTVRLPPELKAEFAAIAEKEAKPIGELLSELVRERVKLERRREFEAEARRQCLEANAAAQDPNSDEAAVMRELDANFDEFAREEWIWDEPK
jgi:predicted transcriptional regulator